MLVEMNNAVSRLCERMPVTKSTRVLSNTIISSEEQCGRTTIRPEVVWRVLDSPA